MAKSKTTLQPGQKLPPRGRSYKNLLLDVLREESLLNLKSDSTREQAEKAFISAVAKRALDEDADGSQHLLVHMLNKSYSSLKQVAPEVQVSNFPHDGTPTQKAQAIMNSIANGEIPADIGAIIIGATKDCVVIEEGTELKARIVEIEKKLGIES